MYLFQYLTNFITANFSTSDHYSISFSLITVIPISHISFQTINFSQTNWPSSNIHRDSIDWFSIFSSCPDVPTMFVQWSSIIDDTISRFIAKNSCTASKRSVHSGKIYPLHMRTLESRKHPAWSLYRSNPSQATMVKYNFISSAYRKTIYVHRCNKEKMFGGFGQSWRFP